VPVVWSDRKRMELVDAEMGLEEACVWREESALFFQLGQ
jgi:hypothetical protein